MNSTPEKSTTTPLIPSRSVSSVWSSSVNPSSSSVNPSSSSVNPSPISVNPSPISVSSSPINKQIQKLIEQDSVFVSNIKFVQITNCSNNYIKPCPIKYSSLSSKTI